MQGISPLVSTVSINPIPVSDRSAINARLTFWGANEPQVVDASNPDEVLITAGDAAKAATKMNNKWERLALLLGAINGNAFELIADLAPGWWLSLIVGTFLGLGTWTLSSTLTRQIRSSMGKEFFSGKKLLRQIEKQKI